MRQDTPVAVTGMGIITASGNDLASNMAALENETATVSQPPFDTDFTSPVFLCSLDAPEQPDATGSCSRTLLLALHAAREAFSSAGFHDIPIKNLRLGVVVGTSVGASLNFFSYYKATAFGETPSLDEIDEYLNSNPALAIGHIFQSCGPALTVTNACSSGADAIGLAAGWIRLGLCDIALAGGADAISDITYKGFNSLRLTSQEICRPFDIARQGLTLGEGAAFMLLESESSRRRRGAAAKSFISGYGTATDAHHITAPHPQCRGLKSAVCQAFAQAGTNWCSIAFCNAHGTGTPTNDAAEGGFLHAECPELPFIATKGVTGHTLGAAGAVEAIFTAVHLNGGILPPSPRFAEADPAIGAAPVCKPTKIQGDMAVSQSLAFGGNNSVLVLSRGEI
ncbi:MAG: beta-ketoacyl-[acyl-carrier-protein] synthase family protein [Desulfovibrio sp.]|jgi:3-oxoacyl-(acyl-carrier-protein) synthase|nr:beta-ketoacyl-[acyl-carrier-protein] synthase family protein [Desulfovibrio sp.]